MKKLMIAFCFIILLSHTISCGLSNLSEGSPPPEKYEIEQRFIGEDDRTIVVTYLYYCSKFRGTHFDNSWEEIYTSSEILNTTNLDMIKTHKKIGMEKATKFKELHIKVNLNKN